MVLWVKVFPSPWRWWQSMHLGVLLKEAAWLGRMYGAGLQGAQHRGEIAASVGPWFGDVVLSMLCLNPWTAVVVTALIPHTHLYPQAPEQILFLKFSVITFLQINMKFMINLCSCDQGGPRIRKRWGEITKEDQRGRWLQARESNQSLLVHLWHWQSLMLCIFNYWKFDFWGTRNLLHL